MLYIDLYTQIKGELIMSVEWNWYFRVEDDYDEVTIQRTSEQVDDATVFKTWGQAKLAGIKYLQTRIDYLKNKKRELRDRKNPNNS